MPGHFIGVLAPLHHAAGIEIGVLVVIEDHRFPFGIHGVELLRPFLRDALKSNHGGSHGKDQEHPSDPRGSAEAGGLGFWG